MGDGLRRATLAALLSRGPWASTTLGDAWTLTSDEVAALYAAVPQGKAAMEHVLGDVLGSRKGDRALQLLRRAGLIVFSRPGGWRQVGQVDAE